MNFIKALILDDLIEFLDVWFFHIPRRIIRNYFDQVYFLDKDLALKANFRNLQKPLYGDYSLIGYLIALPYRLLKIISSFIIYFLLLIIYFLLIALWVILPFFLLYGILFSK